MHTVLQSDARESTHPMVANVDDPSSINGIFDDVSYNKGININANFN
jgi:aminopeptidase N